MVYLLNAYLSKIKANNNFNPYYPNVTFLCSLKTSENQRFSDVYRGYRNVTLGEYGLNTCSVDFQISPKNVETDLKELRLHI